LTTRQVAIVGGTVGLFVSGAVLVLIWFGVAGALAIGHTDLMYLLWPSSLMLTVTWDKSLIGITLTVISVAVNIVMYGVIAILLDKAFRLSLWKSE
jgi:hypothetical protein